MCAQEGQNCGLMLEINSVAFWQSNLNVPFHEKHESVAWAAHPKLRWIIEACSQNFLNFPTVFIVIQQLSIA